MMAQLRPLPVQGTEVNAVHRSGWENLVSKPRREAQA